MWEKIAIDLIEFLRFFAICCDLLRFNAIFFSEIKLDTGKRLKRTVKIYSLHGFPFRYSRKFKIDRVESYGMTYHGINTCTVNQGEQYFFSTNVVEAVREFFLICMLYVSVYIFTHN